MIRALDLANSTCRLGTCLSDVPQSKFTDATLASITSPEAKPSGVFRTDSCHSRLVRLLVRVSSRCLQPPRVSGGPPTAFGRSWNAPITYVRHLAITLLQSFDSLLLLLLLLINRGQCAIEQKYTQPTKSTLLHTKYTHLVKLQRRQDGATYQPTECCQLSRCRQNCQRFLGSEVLTGDTIEYLCMHD